MTAAEAGTVRRILVALDSSPASLGALATAAALAQRLGAALEGIFVEDADVLRAAGLPSASEVSLPSGARRPLSRLAVEEELRALAATAREALAAAARAGGVAWTFRVARGRVSVELLHAAGSADLLVLGHTGRGVGAGPGGTARAAAARAARPVLFHREGVPPGGPLLVAHDGSPAADRALEVALGLAGVGGVTLLVAAPSADAAERLAAATRARTGRPDLAARWIGGATRDDLARAVAGAGGLVVVGADSSLASGGQADRLLDDVAAALLIVR